jgi:hypothetical protein
MGGEEVDDLFEVSRRSGTAEGNACHATDHISSIYQAAAKPFGPRERFVGEDLLSLSSRTYQLEGVAERHVNRAL